MYIVFDISTGEVIEKHNSLSYATERADILTQVWSWAGGRKYEVGLA